MFKSYFNVALRNLLRYKAFSFINIAGLALGLACCLLIFIYIRDERSYDRHWKGSKRLYRVTTETSGNGRLFRMGSTPAPVAFTMKQDFPEVEQVTRLVNPPGITQNVLTYQHTQFFEQKGFMADSTFFDVFDYHFLSGNPQKALAEPNSVVLSEPIASKLFGGQPALNKVIQINNSFGKMDYKVTGVFSSQQPNSHIDARFFTSMNSKGFGDYITGIKSWGGNNFFFTYIKLRPHTVAKALEAKLPAFLDKYAGQELKEAGYQKAHFLQPVVDIHLRSALETELSQNGSITTIYILTSIAGFILLIACINFMNLSTARSARRAREVGVRKIVGAYRSMLIGQFLGESLLISCIAIALAVLLTELFLPVFNQLTGKSLVFFLNGNPWQFGWVLLLALLTGVLAGSYPAFYLSSFQPTAILKGGNLLGKNTHALSASALRKALVVFQFSISICLIVSTVVILNQLRYIQQKNLGFDKEQKIIIPLRVNEATSQLTVLKNELQKNSQVISVAGSSCYPGMFIINDNGFYPEGKTPNDAINAKINFVDYGLIETMGYALQQGRTFSPDRIADDSTGIVVNEAMVKAMGWKTNEALGKRLKRSWGPDQNLTHEIIGVVKDFHFQSLYEEVHPFLFMRYPKQFGDMQFPYLVASVKSNDVSGLLTNIRTTWEAKVPAVPFEYTFLNEEVARQYQADQRLSQIVGNLTSVAIFISCLGLFGLAAFTAEQRTKEIGIRKVLGASVTNIVGLLSKDFLKLVLLANVIAWPIAWYAMSRWLEDFAYRIDIPWWVFGLAAGAALVIALLTVSFQAVKVAVANPVKSLRME